MKKKPLIRSLVIASAAGIAVTPNALAEWNIDTPAEYSQAGAYSAGTGALMTLASPLYLVGAVAESGNGYESSDMLHRAGTGPSVMGMGIVYILEGTRRGLTELTVDALDVSANAVGSVADAVHSTAPRARVRYRDSEGKNQEKDIPLVVRPECVQLNERVEIQP